jgi:hypothetical protein
MDLTLLSRVPLSLSLAHTLAPPGLDKLSGPFMHPTFALSIPTFTVQTGDSPTAMVAAVRGMAAKHGGPLYTISLAVTVQLDSND